MHLLSQRRQLNKIFARPPCRYFIFHSISAFSFHIPGTTSNYIALAVSVLLGRGTASFDQVMTTFRGQLSALNFCTFRSLKMRPVGCFETSGTNSPATRCHIPEERSERLDCERVTARMHRTFNYLQNYLQRCTVHFVVYLSNIPTNAHIQSLII